MKREESTKEELRGRKRGRRRSKESRGSKMMEDVRGGRSEGKDRRKEG